MKKYTSFQIILFLLLFPLFTSYGQDIFDTHGNNKAVGKYVEINGAKIYY